MTLSLSLTWKRNFSPLLLLDTVLILGSKANPDTREALTLGPFSPKYVDLSPSLSLSPIRDRGTESFALPPSV